MTKKERRKLTKILESGGLDFDIETNELRVDHKILKVFKSRKQQAYEAIKEILEEALRKEENEEVPHLPDASDLDEMVKVKLGIQTKVLFSVAATAVDVFYAADIPDEEREQLKTELQSLHKVLTAYDPDYKKQIGATKVLHKNDDKI